MSGSPVCGLVRQPEDAEESLLRGVVRRLQGGGSRDEEADEERHEDEGEKGRGGHHRTLYSAEDSRGITDHSTAFCSNKTITAVSHKIANKNQQKIPQRNNPTHPPPPVLSPILDFF